MKCPICTGKAELISRNFQGYVEGTKFNIYSCRNCLTSFIDPLRVSKKLYEKIYSNTENPGYDRYYTYAREIKKQKKPLEFLSNSESTYYPINNFVKGKRNLKILEVGCGYGYLSYALRKEGHEIKGIDISKNAMDFARKNFGNYFEQKSIEALGKDEKYDLIIATELIEHLIDPKKFLSVCKEHLENNGCIIITTPNKGYSSKNAIWKTDLPPVHTFWMKKNTFIELGRILDLKLKFVDYTNYSSRYENKLVNFLYNRLVESKSSIITKSGSINKSFEKTKSSIPRKLFRLIMFRFYPVRKFCNISHDIFIKDYNQIGVVLWKNQSK